MFDAASALEMKARLAALEARHAPANNFTFNINTARSYQDVSCSMNCYLTRSGNGRDFFHVTGMSFEDCEAQIDAKLGGRKAELRAKVVRELALRLIETTADHGSCSTAQLRGTVYTEADINEFRAEIEAEANKLATAGQPFVIVDAPPGNGAPADEPTEFDSDIPF